MKMLLYFHDTVANFHLIIFKLFAAQLNLQIIAQFKLELIQLLCLVIQVSVSDWICHLSM